MHCCDTVHLMTCRLDGAVPVMYTTVAKLPSTCGNIRTRGGSGGSTSPVLSRSCVGPWSETARAFAAACAATVGSGSASKSSAGGSKVLKVVSEPSCAPLWTKRAEVRVGCHSESGHSAVAAVMVEVLTRVWSSHASCCAPRNHLSPTRCFDRRRLRPLSCRLLAGPLWSSDQFFNTAKDGRKSISHRKLDCAMLLLLRYHNFV
jgi:hypothetical protein